MKSASMTLALAAAFAGTACTAPGAGGPGADVAAAPSGPGYGMTVGNGVLQGYGGSGGQTQAGQGMAQGAAPASGQAAGQPQGAARPAGPAAGQGPGGGPCGGYGPGMMGGYGPGMMGPGMMRGYGYGYGYGHGPGPGMMGGYGGGWDANIPGLTNEQRSKMAEIQRQFHQKQVALMQSMHERFRSAQMYRDGKFDEQAARQSYAATEKLRRQMFENHLEMQKHIDAVLTPQQRQQLQRGRGER